MAKKDNNLPFLLIVLDGWGISKEEKGNAVRLAKTPTIDGLGKKYPYSTLYAHGKHVGLPDGQVGNSEAGHMNIGAGRSVKQDSVRISESIKNGTFYKNSAFLGAIRHVRKMGSKMHLIGMLSNGQSPHSDPGHLFALLKLMKDNHIKDICVHVITDGRDSPKYAALKLVDDLEKKNIGGYFHISSIMGRFYAMDRKKKWQRTEIAFNALTSGKGRIAPDPKSAITESYNRGDSDEYIQPYLIADEHGQLRLIEDGDSVVFFNLRSDRARQLTKSFVQQKFYQMNPGSFKRKKRFNHLYFAAMTDFGPDLDDVLTAYPSIDIPETLPLAIKGLKQLYIAEAEKFAHVTYFFNGGYAGKIAGEDQVMLPSPDVKSYDMTPAMNTRELAAKILSFVDQSKKTSRYDFIFLNIAAPDMVGHTGNLEAGIACCSEVDKAVARLVKGFLAVNGTIMITADHGNIEKMINLKTGEIHTEHTTNKVPLILVGRRFKGKDALKASGALGDVAPTFLDIIGCPKPKAMSGKSLLKKKI